MQQHLKFPIVHSCIHTSVDGVCEVTHACGQLSELQCLLTRLLENTSTVQQLLLAFIRLHCDFFCSERGRNVYKEGSRECIPMEREHVVFRPISRWKRSVETSPTDKGDREFQLPPGNHELVYQMHFIILLQSRCETMKITMHLVTLLVFVNTYCFL